MSALWFACTEPERPTDPFVTWHYEECVGCRVKAAALASMYPDDSHVRWLTRMMSEPEAS